MLGAPGGDRDWQQGWDHGNGDQGQGGGRGGKAPRDDKGKARGGKAPPRLRSQTQVVADELRRWLDGDGHRSCLKVCIDWENIMPSSSFPGLLGRMGLSVGTFVPLVGMHPATPELDNCFGSNRCQYEDHAEPKMLLHGTQWNCLARILSSGRLVRGNRPKMIGAKNKVNAFGVFLCDTATRAARYSPAGSGPLGLRTFLLMRCSRTKHYGDGQYICREHWVEISALILTSCHDLDGGQNCASTLQEEQHLVHPIPHQAWFCSWDLPEPTVLSSLWEDFRWKPGG